MSPRGLNGGIFQTHSPGVSSHTQPGLPLRRQQPQNSVEKIPVVSLCYFHACQSFRRYLPKRSAKGPSRESSLFFKKPRELPLTMTTASFLGSIPFNPFSQLIHTAWVPDMCWCCAEPQDTHHRLPDDVESRMLLSRLHRGFCLLYPIPILPAFSTPIISAALRAHKGLPNASSLIESLL